MCRYVVSRAGDGARVLLISLRECKMDLVLSLVRDTGTPQHCFLLLKELLSTRWAGATTPIMLTQARKQQ